MNDPNIPVTEDELHAYVDNELPAERRGDVEAWLAAHPDDAERVQSWRAMAEVLHARYDFVVPTSRAEAARDRAAGAAAAPDGLRRRAAVLVAFVAGGASAGWRTGAAATPTVFQSFTVDALDAHRLYVVEVRHPVEVPGSERAHLQAWLTRRCGWTVCAPGSDATGLKLVGGRLLPGPTGPASFLMYESASGERFTIYTSRAKTETAQMRYTTAENSGAMFWSEPASAMW